ncbi:MAG: hypothetical protein IPN53_05120 [Comamonadaceae bacterium]|nr:hypothetical protein [Comamonadaceae bacterium]
MQIMRTPTDPVFDPELRKLIERVFATVSDCPEILGFILIVEPGDTIANIDALLRFPILAGRHEFILEHTDWFELVFIISDDGFGITGFLPKTAALPELLAMCQQHAIPADATHAGY